MSPPNTADRRVLFLLAMDTQRGERNKDTPIDKDPNQPVGNKEQFNKSLINQFIRTNTSSCPTMLN